MFNRQTTSAFLTLWPKVSQISACRMWVWWARNGQAVRSLAAATHPWNWNCLTESCVFYLKPKLHLWISNVCKIVYVLCKTLRYGKGITTWQETFYSEAHCIRPCIATGFPIQFMLCCWLAYSWWDRWLMSERRFSFLCVSPAHLLLSAWFSKGLLLLWHT